MRKTSVIVLALAAACVQPRGCAGSGDRRRGRYRLRPATQSPTSRATSRRPRSARQRAAAAVLPLEDIQYNSASLSNINGAYHPTWGRVKSISRPILGNHESSGTGYFDYFNGVGVADGLAGPRPTGYYSFDVGSWHLVALNSNCDRVSCSAGSEQEMAARGPRRASRCALSPIGTTRATAPATKATTRPCRRCGRRWTTRGRDRPVWSQPHYERVAPVDRNGGVDVATGIRQFVVGTGGAFFTGGLDTLIPQSEAAQNTTFGVLFLTLRPTSYDWRFVRRRARPTPTSAAWPVTTRVAPCCCQRPRRSPSTRARL